MHEAVANLPENHHEQPPNVSSTGAPIVPEIGAPIPLSVEVTIGMTPRAPAPPIAPIAEMETIHVWQQRQEALENMVIQLADTVRALAQT